MSARRRILFVDDDARARDMLQRVIRPFSAAWDATFVGGAREALDALAHGSFDAVVTDLSMPGMSGVELLAAVQTSHPQIARIVLAPASEQPLLMTCGSVAHQFLTRPCDPEALRIAVDRACDLEASIRREQIGKLVGRMDRLPSLPDLYHKLVERMEDPECSIDDVAELVARDISMTARILKLVNSAFFGLRRQVASPVEAVNYLGLDTTKALVLSINAFAQFERVTLGGVSLEALWNHSLLAAGCAKLIADYEEAGPRLLDEAFVAGMLHDTGKLALAANFGKEYVDVVKAGQGSATGLIAAEEAAFGATHAEVGGYLLGLWSLPGAIVDAVTWHHKPLGCPDQTFSPLSCVHAADVWVHDEDSPEARPVLDKEYYENLGLTARLADWRDACNESHSVGSEA